MIEIKRVDSRLTLIKENGVLVGESTSFNGGRVLLNKAVKDEYVDANSFTKSKIKKNPTQAIMDFFPNLSLSQEIVLVGF